MRESDRAIAIAMCALSLAAPVHAQVMEQRPALSGAALPLSMPPAGWQGPRLPSPAAPLTGRHSVPDVGGPLPMLSAPLAFRSPSLSGPALPLLSHLQSWQPSFTGPIPIHEPAPGW